MIDAGPDKRQRLERNIALFPWYMGTFQAYCWLPVFFLFFLDKLPIEQVLWLESIFFLAVVVLEIPSGYFSDTIGRRTTLIISALGIVSAHGLFYYGASTERHADQVFTLFALAQVLLAIGTSFKSGTDTTLHYDSLKALGREAEYADREAIASRNGFLACALAALLGGLVASFELRYAYATSLVMGLITFSIALQFIEPGNGTQTKSSNGLGQQLAACVAQLSNPSLAWLFGFAVFMTVLNHLPYEFYQPYIGLLGEQTALFSRGTPLAAGIHTALTMIIASWVAAKSIQLRNRIGLAATLFLVATIQLVTIALMSLMLSPVIALILLIRSTPRALMSAPLNAAITPQLPETLRATYLSLQSLVGRLGFSVLLAVLPFIAASGVQDSAVGLDWQTISAMLHVCALLGSVGFLVLLASVSKAKLAAVE